MLEFVSIDVETANADMASICQIGVARFVDGALTEEWKSYVDPCDYFDGVNVSIHGITEATVRGSPIFSKLEADLVRLLNGSVVVCHTHFDRTALHQASVRNRVAPPSCIWLDSARVARRAWAECATSGYGLSSVCKIIGYEFKHHDALEDAKAAGRIVIAAVQRTGLDIQGWIKRVDEPIDPSDAGPLRRAGNPDGPLSGEVIAFTGALEIPRRKAADLAARAGCAVEPSVTKRTTILVVGDQDVRDLAGFDKSSKHRKAEDLAHNGQRVRIVRETDFKQLIGTALRSAASLRECV